MSSVIVAACTSKPLPTCLTHQVVLMVSSGCKRMTKRFAFAPNNGFACGLKFSTISALREGMRLPVRR